MYLEQVCESINIFIIKIKSKNLSFFSIRQLCQWWRGKGYDNVFDEYYDCKGEINILHGNCDTPFPSDESNDKTEL